MAWRPRLTRRISWAPSGWIGDWTTPEDNTKLLTVSCSDDFHAVRVGFANRTPNAWKMNRCIAAPSATLNDGCNPTGNSGWRPFTFAGAGLDLSEIATDPDAPTAIAIAGNKVDPLSGDTTIPHWTWSDWIPLASIARADRLGAPRLLMIRTLVEKGTHWTGPNGGFGGYGLNHAINLGFEHICGSYPIDAATNPFVVNVDAAGLGGPAQPVACVQFLTRHEGVVGMTAGDSHHQGTTTTTQFLSYLLQATTLLGSRCIGRIPFGCVNCAQGGLTSQQIFAALRALLPAVSPTYVVLPGWTWNETTGPIHADAAATEIFLARLLAAAEACTQNGARPIFLTPFPRNAAEMTPVQVGPWKALRYAILELRQAGATVIDATDILGHRMDGDLTGTYHAHMTSDTAHPNDTGHAAIAVELVATLERALHVPSGSSH